MNESIAINCQSISKSFDSFAAVNQLSLQINHGEILGFLGPNGAGKTTTISMICGLLKPDQGNILIEGKNLSQNPELKRNLGICPQENVFWPKLTGIEQLIFMGQMYGLRPRDIRTRSKLLLADLGLENHAGKIASKWSGGMKRRLSIALALIHDPEILILDEPEAGLDPQSRIMVRDYIRSLTPRKTIILTTHNMDEADRMATRIAIIDHGNLIALGTSKELKDATDGKDKVEEVIIREKTLEDVFIKLTGKNLRS